MAVLIIRGTSACEIPEAASRRDNELSAPNYERTDPKQAEQVVDPHVSGYIVPLHACQNRCSWALWRCPDAVHVYGRYDPEDNPHSDDQEEGERHEEYAGRIPDEVTRRLDDGRAELDARPAAAENQEIDAREDPKEDADSMHDLVGVVGWIISGS